ncbi:hypothetical protein OB905_02930 [Halobacteria archaeon AArc-dxtr1]|nr:hypothetical protein [Halobacteria archaeon AArc-dxtr1]
MTEKRAPGDADGTSTAPSGTESEEGGATHHLAVALENATDPDARYHLREAMQLLTECRDR